LHFNFNFF